MHSREDGGNMDDRHRLKMPALRRAWVLCPYCGAKHSLYDDQAECKGVYVKCSRGCKREFEIIIHNGIQQKTE